MDYHRNAVADQDRVSFGLRHEARHERIVGGNQYNGVLFALRAREIDNRLHIASAVSRDRKTCRQAAKDLGAFRMAMKPLSEDGKVGLRVSGRDRVRARRREFTLKRRAAQIESFGASLSYAPEAYKPAVGNLHSATD